MSKNQLSSSPDVVWALVPAVAATLKNAVLALRPIKKPRFLRHFKPLKAYAPKPITLASARPTSKFLKSVFSVLIC